MKASAEMKKCEHHETEPVSGRDKYYYYPDGKEAGFLCDTCAHNDGFCPFCGWFVSGNEWDGLSMAQYGMCSECADEVFQDNEYEE